MSQGEGDVGAGRDYTAESGKICSRVLTLCQDCAMLNILTLCQNRELKLAPFKLPAGTR